MRRTRLVILPAALAAAMATAALAQAWLTYANDRFGATVDYPPIFSVRAEPPANGDGQRFLTRDETASLAVYGFFNVLKETPRQMLESRREAGVAYTYTAAERDSFVLSGTRGDRILYERCVRAGSDIVNCVDVEYPRAEVRQWDAIVTRISRSLRSGKPS